MSTPDADVGADPGENDEGATIFSALGDNNDASLRAFENLEAKAVSSSSWKKDFGEGTMTVVVSFSF